MPLGNHPKRYRISAGMVDPDKQGKKRLLQQRVGRRTETDATWNLSINRRLSQLHIGKFAKDSYPSRMKACINELGKKRQQSTWWFKA